MTAFLPWSLQAIEVQPILNAELLGGQYFYNGADNSFSAIASLTAAPYLKLNDQWSVVPLYSGNYHGTQQVQDLIGGGTLFQDSQEHTLSLKTIRSFQNGLKLKAVGGYSVQYLRETKDETWGNALYDNRRAFGGAEAEWTLTTHRLLRLAYDYYSITFPNYQSLESQATTQDLGREFNQPDVLDTHNHSATATAQWDLPYNGLLDLSLNYTIRLFSEQHLVDETSALLPDLRHDHIYSASAQGTWPVFVDPAYRVFGSLGYNWTRLSSNQNHYDATQTFFNGDYYSYTQNSIENNWTLAVGEDPWTVSLHGILSRQQYTDRLIQDALGAYGTDTTHVDSAAIGIGFTYPIAKGFHLETRFDWGWNNSNNEDNAVYQYHYNTATYLLGFHYEY